MKKALVIVLPLVIISVLVWQYSGDILSSLNHLWYGHLKKASQVLHKPIDLPPGTVVPLTFDSKLLSMPRTAQVYLPPNYATEKDTRQYPTLYLLHGFTGAPKDYLINAGLAELLDELIEQQMLPPTIVVLVDGNGPKKNDSQYLNATLVNQPMEDHIIEELVPAIDLAYATDATSSSRAIGGVSTGGYGAVNILLHHPDIFSIGISHSGYFLSNDPASKKLFGTNQATYAFNSPLLYLPTLDPTPAIHVYFDIGDIDQKYLAVNSQFDQLLTEKGIDHVYKVTTGWHTWGVWRENLKSSLTWLGKFWQ